MAGLGRGPADQPVLRISPQHGDLVAVCVDLQPAAREVQVGRDGRLRVTPRPARPVSAPAGHRRHRLRRHPAQPHAQETAPDRGREHDPGDEQRHLQRHLLGAPRVRHRRRRDRTAPPPPARGGPLCARPRRLRGDRPGAPCPGGRDRVRGGPSSRRRPDLGGHRPAPRARAARPGAAQLRSPLLRVRQARLDRRDHELRGARSAAGSRLLHLLLPARAHPRRPGRSACADVAEDHPLRRPLALAREECRSPLPETRCRHAA